MILRWGSGSNVVRGRRRREIDRGPKGGTGSGGKENCSDRRKIMNFSIEFTINLQNVYKLDSFSLSLSSDEPNFISFYRGSGKRF